ATESCIGSNECALAKKLVRKARSYRHSFDSVAATGGSRYHPDVNQPERLNGNSRRSRWLSRFALIVLLLAILYLIYLNLATNSPIQQIAVGSLPQLALEQQLSAADETCRAVAGDGNLAIHFDGFDASHFQQGLLMSQFY